MNQNNQPLLKAFIIIVIIAAVLSSILVLVGNGDATSSKILGIAFSLLLYGITGTVGFAIQNKSSHQILGSVTIVVSALAFLLNAALIFGGSGLATSSEGLLKLTFGLMIVAVALAHISFLFHINTVNKYATYARIVAVIFISIFSFLIIVKIFDSFQSLYMMASQQSYLRFLSAALIIDLSATILVPLCNRLHVSKADELKFPFSSLPVDPVNPVTPVVQDLG